MMDSRLLSRLLASEARSGMHDAIPTMTQKRFVILLAIRAPVLGVLLKTGIVIWEKHIGREYEVAEMSCRPSPLIEGSLLIVFTGAKPGASVMALDKQTGKEAWKALDDHVSNSSPGVLPFRGRRQLIVWSGNSI